MSNYIRQNKENIANEPSKVEQPLLESSREMYKLSCITNTEHSPDTKITVFGTSFPAEEILFMASFNWLSLRQSKYLLKKPKNETHSFTRRFGKNFPEKSVQKIIEHL